MTDHLGQLALTLPPEIIEAIAERAAEIVLAQVREEQADASPWMTAAEAAEYLRWPRKRIYNLTAARAIPHYKHDGRLLFRRDELDRMLDGCREGRPIPALDGRIAS